MAKFEEHCQDCVNELGEPFPQVHIWLDELFILLKHKHREIRHNSESVEEIREKWGDMAAKAAEIHIKKDYGTNKIPNKKEAQMYSFFGSNSDNKGSSIIG
jgi:hypothetical protein